MIAIDGRLPLSFTAGLLAAVNPCGFVLLPTYLLYFLGMENLRPGAERTSVGRAIAVSVSVSAGFMSVFVVLGVAMKWSTDWFANSIMDTMTYVSLIIGLALVVLGTAMIFGYRLPFTTPKLDVGQRDRSVRSMFVFGIAYAIASLGCTIGPFSSVVLGTVITEGLFTGVAAIAVYGLGMALLVTGLTVSLAMANTALLRTLRRGMEWFEYVAGVFVVLTGLYLTYYWYSNISENENNDVVAQATSWQEDLARFIDRNQTAVVLLACSVIAGAVGLALYTKRRPHAG